MDPYAILCVNSSDSFEVIRSAYLIKARQCHPDKTGNSSAREFLHVQQAWTIVKNKFESPDYVKSVNSGSVSFSELVPGDDGLVYDCRCGDIYEVSKNYDTATHIDTHILCIGQIHLDDLKSGFNTFQCCGCSLYITLDDVPDFNTN
jgi:hypothetical protein